MIKFRVISFTTLMIALAIIWTIAMVSCVLDDIPRCDWDSCRIFGKGNNFVEFRICDRCDNELKKWSGIILNMTFLMKNGSTGEEWDAKRRQWIYERIKEKKNWREPCEK